MISSLEQALTLDDSTNNYTYPNAANATFDKDTLHYGEMLATPDRANFVNAMKKETGQLASGKHG
jgi:hypothetical protein